VRLRIARHLDHPFISVVLDRSSDASESLATEVAFGECDPDLPGLAAELIEPVRDKASNAVIGIDRHVADAVNA
jgi:hypothetical protein